MDRCPFSGRFLFRAVSSLAIDIADSYLHSEFEVQTICCWILSLSDIRVSYWLVFVPKPCEFQRYSR